MCHSWNVTHVVIDLKTNSAHCWSGRLNSYRLPELCLTQQIIMSTTYFISNQLLSGCLLLLFCGREIHKRYIHTTNDIQLKYCTIGIAHDIVLLEFVTSCNWERGRCNSQILGLTSMNMPFSVSTPNGFPRLNFNGICVLLFGSSEKFKTK